MNFNRAHNFANIHIKIDRNLSRSRPLRLLFFFFNWVPINAFLLTSEQIYLEITIKQWIECEDLLCTVALSDSELRYIFDIFSRLNELNELE